MKIQNNQPVASGSAELARAQQAEAASGRRGSASAGSAADDRAQVSDLSGKLLRMLDLESSGRTAQVNRLAADFQAGRYQPDAVAVSRSILEEALKPA